MAGGAEPLSPAPLDVSAITGDFFNARVSEAFSFALAAPMVLRRKFSEEGTLQAVEENDCRVLAVVPVMLQRMLELPRGTVNSRLRRALDRLAESIAESES